MDVYDGFMNIKKYFIYINSKKDLIEANIYKIIATIKNYHSMLTV